MSVRRFLIALLAAGWLLDSAAAYGDLFVRRARLFPVGPNPCAIVAGDLNDDGLPELITADRGQLTNPQEERPANDELSLLIAREELEYVKHHPSLKTGFGPYAITLANIDALKWPDIIVVNFLASRNRDITLFLNLQTEQIFELAAFSVPDQGLAYFRQRDGEGAPIFTKPGLTACAVRDFNGDGLRDLVTTCWSSDALALLPGHADTYFDVPVFFESKGGPRDIALGDFDSDGHTDLAVAMYASNEVALWRGDGTLGFEEVTRFPTRGRLPTCIRAADFNTDGQLDLAVSHRYTDDSIVLFFGTGSFHFGLSQELMLGENRELLECGIRDIAVADLNEDGRADIAAACYSAGVTKVLINEEAASTASPRFRTEEYRFPDARPRAVCVADFNSDGKRDLAVALWEANAVGLLIQQ